MVVNNFNALTKEIQKRIDKSLKNEVFEEIRDVEQKNIDEYVYDVYQPKIYKRRETNGGLIDDKNIVGELIKSGELEVTNVTKPNSDYNGTTNKDLPYLIENGLGEKGYKYDYPADLPYVYPRPFTEKTKEELIKTKKHVKALEKGLKNNGLNVK